MTLRGKFLVAEEFGIHIPSLFPDLVTPTKHGLDKMDMDCINANTHISSTIGSA
jgi:hypothetical protein